MAQLFKNNVSGVLSAPISDSSTVLSLVAGQGARFPLPTGGDYFLATLIGLDSNGAENAWEIVKVTTRATDGLTIARAQEGTAAQAWNAGSRLEMRITSGTLSAIAASAKSGVLYTNAAASLSAGIQYLVDSTGGSFTLNMPPSPTINDLVTFTDLFSTWSINPVTLNRNGSNFVDQAGNSQAEDFDLNISGSNLTFIYTASGWRAI